MPPAIDATFFALQEALAGEYSLERELGRGGMGIVYLAREIQLDRLVAIKALPPALAVRDDVREQFIREARMSAALSHPNIVPIYRVGVAGALVYFAMAFIEGETLGERLRSRGQLATAMVGRVLREVAQALAYAHGRGIVHRDVKPDNIFLERATGRTLVMDFGIARAASDAHASDPERVMGTVQFMSPEQALNQPLDARSDLFSLGVVGFLAVSGRLPHPADRVETMLTDRVTRPAPPVASVARGVDSALAAAIDRCLQRDPRDRFATGEELAASLGGRADTGGRLPPALRAWAENRDPLRPVYLLWLLIVGGIGLADLVDGGGGAWEFFAMAAAPLVPMTLAHLRSTYHTLRSGFAIADLRLAMHVWRDERLEEISAAGDSDLPLWKRITRGGTIGSSLAAIGFSAASFLAMAKGDYVSMEAIGGWLAWLWPICLGAVPVCAALGVPLIDHRLLHRMAGALRSRFWDSALGGRVARLLGGRRDQQNAQFAHRPTEMALGIAAEDLFRALPAPVQKDLRSLPAIVERLGRHAARARARVQRDGDPAAQQALAEAVAALDAIRLDLLRLHGGIEDLRPITTVLEAAARVGEELDRLNAANRSVNAVLDRPSSLSRTPTSA
jgi:serine/threonine-protein kinase